MNNMRVLSSEFCQYVDGPCDQDFSTSTSCDALFLFPSTPPQIAATIESANEAGTNVRWTDLEILATASYYRANYFL